MVSYFTFCINNIENYMTKKSTNDTQLLTKLQIMLLQMCTYTHTHTFHQLLFAIFIIRSCGILTLFQYISIYPCVPPTQTNLSSIKTLQRTDNITYIISLSADLTASMEAETNKIMPQNYCIYKVTLSLTTVSLK